MGDPFWREGFGPMLPETEAVPFGDLDGAGAASWPRKQFAAFIVEPIQGEGGVRIATAGVSRKRPGAVPAPRDAVGR